MSLKTPKESNVYRKNNVSRHPTPKESNIYRKNKFPNHQTPKELNIYKMKKKEAQILIVDDSDDILFSAKVWLKRFFSEVITLNNPKNILKTLSENSVDVILLDMNFRRGFEDGQEGLYWLKEIKQVDKNIPVILMTAYGEVSLAVEALKSGATDFILKPWNNEKLYASVNLAVDFSRKNHKLSQWENLQQNHLDYVLESKSPVMKTILGSIKRVAPTEANVLILGENGTGKYVLAEYIHQQSERSKEPFVHIDLGAMSESLFESELFGYAKGAYTDAKTEKAGKLENAQGGTVFLDEIGNLPLHLQTKLLTLIQNKKFSRIGENKERLLDVRFIFATNENLQNLVNEGKFRQDLYFRINTVEIKIPALRERLEDMELLANYFVTKHHKKYKKEHIQLLENDIESLKTYYWPGNIRELDHLLERAIIMSDNELLLNIPSNFIQKNIFNENNLNIEQMEEELIKKALEKYKGNISTAAEALGLTRASLYRRMEKFGL